MMSEPAGVFCPLSALKLVATVFTGATVCETGGATTRKVTRLPSPGDRDRVDVVGSAADPVPVPLENAGSGILATVMYACCTVKSQVAFMLLSSRLATGVSYTLCCTSWHTEQFGPAGLLDVTGQLLGLDEQLAGQHDTPADLGNS